MRPEDILNKSIQSIKDGIDTIDNKYESHIREKAQELVDEKLKEKGLKKEYIEKDDYEMMISDLSKDIKQDYTKKVGQGLLAFIGIDMLLGL